MKKIIPSIKIITIILVVASFFALFYSSVVLNKNISFTNDELWDYMPAVAIVNNEFIVESQGINVLGYKIPLVTGPYQGALKTWIAAPIIYVFGTSPLALRTLNIVTALLFLFAFYWALLGLLEKKYAILVFLIPFFDGNFLLTSPLDYGSFLFQSIFIVLGFGCIFRFFILKDIRYLWLLSLFTGCLLAHKLTSVPIVLLFIFIFLFGSLIFRMFLKDNGWISSTVNILLVSFVLFLLPLIPHIIYFLKSNGLSSFLEMTKSHENIGFCSKVLNNLLYLGSSGSSNGLYWCRSLIGDMNFSPKFGLFTFAYGIYGIYCISILLLILYSNIKIDLRRFVIGGFILFMLSIFSFSLFKGLNRPWHYQLLYPFLWCQAIVSFAYMVDFLSRKNLICKVILYIIYFILGIGLIVSSFFSYCLLERIEQSKGMSITSPVFNDFSKLLKRHKFQKIYSINYSLGWPLYVVLERKLHIVDFAFSQIDSNILSSIMTDLLGNQNVCLVYRYSNYSGEDANWTKWLNKESSIYKIKDFISKHQDKLKVIRINNEFNKDREDIEFVLVYANKGKS